MPTTPSSGRKPAADAPTTKPPPREALERTVAVLCHYNKDPFLLSFFRRYGVKPKGSKAELCQSVLDSLAGSGPLPITYEQYLGDLDDLQRFGAQHVAFFRLPAGKAAEPTLRRLRDVGKVRRHLDEAGWPDRYSKGIHVDLPAQLDRLPPQAAPDPTLASVTRVSDPADSLLFKWIQPRAWYVLVQSDDQGEEVTKTWQRRWERSANFVRIDLASGDSEIMIQRLQPNPVRTMVEELDTYRHLMTSLLQAQLFQTVSLEPVVRHLLTEGVSEVNRWMIKPDKDSVLEGRAGRSTFGSVKILAPFAGRLLHYNWRPEENRRRRIRLQVDVRTETLTLVHPCLPDEHTAILAAVRQATGIQPQLPKLAGVKTGSLEVSF